MAVPEGRYPRKGRIDAAAEPMKTMADNLTSQTNAAARTVDPGTREKIIREARNLFRERGYDGTAMSEMAKRVGLTTAAVYWHFSSKADLCAEVLVRDYGTFNAEMTERSIGDTPEERLRAFAQAFVEVQLREAEAEPNYSYVQLREALPEEARGEIENLERQVIDLLREILLEGQESGEFSIADLSVTAFALSTMLEYVFVWFRPNGRLSRTEMARLHAALAANLVGARSTDRS